MTYCFDGLPPARNTQRGKYRQNWLIRSIKLGFLKPHRESYGMESHVEIEWDCLKGGVGVHDL